MSPARRYYVFSGLISFGLAMTVTSYGPFLESVGLTLSQIALVNSVFWAVVIASELPTGLVADGRSRAFSLKLGALFHSLGAIIYIFADTFMLAAIAESFIAIGVAFLSGATQAWVTDALHRDGKQDQLRRVFATNALVHSGALIVGGFLGAYLAIVDYRLIWLPLAISGLLGFSFARRSMNGFGEPLEVVSEIEALRRAWNQLRTSRVLIWATCALVVFGGVLSFNHYWSLYFKFRIGQENLSWIWVAMYTGLIVSSWVARQTNLRANHEPLAIVCALLIAGLGLSFAGAASTTGFAITAVILHEFGRGFFNPFLNSLVQHKISSSYRATFGSLQSLIGRIGFMIAPLIVGVGIAGQEDSLETIQSVWILSGGFLVVGALILLWRRPQN